MEFQSETGSLETQPTAKKKQTPPLGGVLLFVACMPRACLQANDATCFIKLTSCSPEGRSALRKASLARRSKM